MHSILDYAERVKVDEEEKRLLSAFRYINNSLKHSEKVVEITYKKLFMIVPFICISYYQLIVLSILYSTKKGSLLQLF